jgi:hypothetical protein
MKKSASIAEKRLYTKVSKTPNNKFNLTMAENVCFLIIILSVEHMMAMVIVSLQKGLAGQANVRWIVN